MRWQRISLSLALALGTALAVSGCTENRENPTALDGPDQVAAKPVAPTVMLDIDQAWLAELYNAYASITEWDTYLIPQTTVQGDTFYLVPDGWDPDNPIAITFPEAASVPFVGGGLLVRFPAGKNPFPYNAIFYEMDVWAPLQTIFMSYDPNRYSADVIGSQYTSFQFGAPPQPGELYTVRNLFVGVPDWTTAPQPMRLTLGSGGDFVTLPDREAGVIIPSGGPPATPVGPDD